MLGIIMGVASLIMMVSVGAGARPASSEQIQSLGTNLLIVISNSNNIRGVRGGGGTRADLTEDDAYAIQRKITAVQAAAPTLGATCDRQQQPQLGRDRTGITPEWRRGQGKEPRRRAAVDRGGSSRRRQGRARSANRGRRHLRG